MNQLIHDFLARGVFAFLLTFVRVGAAIMIMPGIGDTMTPQNVRLLFALGLTFVMVPLVADAMPAVVPNAAGMISLIVVEFIIGAFLGTISRVLLGALDTAGMLISVSSGLGSAQLFNPAFATQGSAVGSFLTMSGILMIFATNMHHLLFEAILGSYKAFPVGQMPDTGSMADVMSRVVAAAFQIGLEIAAPFIVITLMLYVGLGVLARLMPSIQVFQLALPAQILISLLTFMIVIGTAMTFWTAKFQDAFMFFLGGGR